MPFGNRKIGQTEVAPLGYGAMGIASFYGQVNSDEANEKVIQHCIDIGCTFIDTADMYGPKTSEELLGRVFAKPGYREKCFLATKCGNTWDEQTGQLNGGVRGDKEYVKKACQASLDRLGIDCIDLYYQHRIDDKVPIEETVGALEELRKEGKVKYIGLSECTADTLRKACKVGKIDAIQMEYSPWALEIEQLGILDAARELGVKIVCYSPLGRGFMTGRYRHTSDFEEGDFRRFAPRFSEENMPKNIELLERFEELAKKKGCTPGQLCLAWIMFQGDDFIPIPGTKTTKYIDENWAAKDVDFTAQDDKEIREVIKSIKIEGGRYPEAHSSSLLR